MENQDTLRDAGNDWSPSYLFVNAQPQGPREEYLHVHVYLRLYKYMYMLKLSRDRFFNRD